MNPSSFLRPWRIAAAAVSALWLAGGAYWALAHGGEPQDAGAAAATPRAMLTVTTVKPQLADWPKALVADGGIAAWQEAVIGSEGGLRLTEVLANVGDAVRRGQVLARYQIRLAQTRLLAPDDGVISSRRALVYVDLPPGRGLQAGMFATGRFELGHSAVLAVPQAAVVTRNGRDYVYRVVAGARACHHLDRPCAGAARDAAQGAGAIQMMTGPKVVQTRVTLGRRLGDQVEGVSSASAGMTLVAQGAGFLADGDTVKLTVMLDDLLPWARRRLAVWRVAPPGSAQAAQAIGAPSQWRPHPIEWPPSQ